jgi:hypothetical protein
MSNRIRSALVATLWVLAFNSIAIPVARATDPCASGTHTCKPQQRCDATPAGGHTCSSPIGLAVQFTQSGGVIQAGSLVIFDAHTPTPLFKLPFTGSGLASPIVAHAIATHPVTGALWLSFTTAGSPRLGVVTLDMATGSAVIRGPSSATPLTTSAVLQALAFDNSGTLWGVTNPNLDARGLPKLTTKTSSVQSVRLYTVSLTTGAITQKMTLARPLVRGAPPYEINGKATSAKFLSDRETLVYDPTGNRLYRFANGLQSIDPSTLATTTVPLGTFAERPAEPRTIWGAVWGWPIAGRIGITAPNLVYSFHTKFPDFYSVSTSGAVQRGFSQPILVETTALTMADLGPAFKDRLWTQAMCETSQACRTTQACFVSTTDNCLGVADDEVLVGGGYYWQLWLPDASCKGRPGCRVWPDNCGQTATCSFNQCRGITTCIGGL